MGIAIFKCRDQVQVRRRLRIGRADFYTGMHIGIDAAHAEFIARDTPGTRVGIVLPFDPATHRT